MDSVIIDTSALYALVDLDDQYHAKSVKIRHALLARSAELIVPNFILAETHTIINRRIGPREALKFLNAALLDYKVERATLEDESRAGILLQGVTRSRNYSYFDAVLAALAERLNIQDIFSFDSHFEHLGFQRTQV